MVTSGGENPKHMALRFARGGFFFFFLFLKEIHHREVVTGMWHDSHGEE